MNFIISAKHASKVRAILLLSMFVSSPLCYGAQVYKSTDSEGNIIFTDQYVGGAQTVNLTETKAINDNSVSSSQANTTSTSTTSTTNSLPNSDIDSSQKNSKKDKDDKNKKKDKDKKSKDNLEPYVLSIQKPKQNDVYDQGTQSIQITGTLNHPLTQGDLIYLYLDGVQKGEGQNSSNFVLNALDRGDHTIKLSVEQGVVSTNKNIKFDRKVLTSSEVITFTQQRARIRSGQSAQ